MATNSEVLAVRIPPYLKKGLEDLYPDVDIRNNVIRAALKRIVDKKLVITSYEIEIASAS